MARACPACQELLPVEARFCPSCGLRLGDPPDEVSWYDAERRHFGVLPGRPTFRRGRVRLARLSSLCVSRIRLAWTATRARVGWQLESLRYRRRRAVLERTRAAAIYEFGEAAYREDDDAVGRAKVRISEIDRLIAAVDQDLESTLHALKTSVTRSREQDGETVVEGKETHQAIVAGEPR